MARKKYSCFDPKVAEAYEKREAIRKAVDAGVMESPLTSLARAFGELGEREQRIGMIHREFGSIKDVVLEKLPRRKVGTGIVEAILRKIKEAENNLIGVVSKS